MSKKSKREKVREFGRSMCMRLGCGFETDDPGCQRCAKCGEWCRMCVYEGTQAEWMEFLELWRAGEIAPWPQLLMAHQAAGLVEPGRLQ